MLIGVHGIDLKMPVFIALQPDCTQQGKSRAMNPLDDTPHAHSL